MRRYRRICRVIPPVIGAARPQNTNLFSSHDHNDDHDRRDLIQNPMQACYVDDVLAPELVDHPTQLICIWIFIICKVPPHIGGHHFLLCQHTKKKNVAG